jgi:hypothetical protein
MALYQSGFEGMRCTYLCAPTVVMFVLVVVDCINRPAGAVVLPAGGVRPAPGHHRAGGHRADAVHGGAHRAPGLCGGGLGCGGWGRGIACGAVMREMAVARVRGGLHTCGTAIRGTKKASQPFGKVANLALT